MLVKMEVRPTRPVRFSQGKQVGSERLEARGVALNNDLASELHIGADADTKERRRFMR